MKHRIVALLVTLSLGLAVAFLCCFPRVDARFATEGYARYHYMGKTVDTRLSDGDLEALKDMLVGRSYGDSPACGFDANVSIRLTDGRRSIVLCPACDSCAKLRVGDSDRYVSISEEQRKRLDGILAKYGVTFPYL